MLLYMKYIGIYCIVGLVIIIIIYHLLNIHSNRKETFKNNPDILTILTNKYKDPNNGLVFRGFEHDCNSLNPKKMEECTMYEINGPHEEGNLTAENQGATTWLTAGMNPYFYPDIGGNASAQEVVLLIMDGIGIGQEKGCQYIQDLGTNGCSPTDPPQCEGPNSAADTYFNTFKEMPPDVKKCNRKGMNCKIGIDAQGKKIFAAQYNKFNELLSKYNTTQDPKGNCTILGMKENQRSYFWSSKSLEPLEKLNADSRGILAIGYLYDENKPHETLGGKVNAELFATAVKTKYNIDVPVVQIYRGMKTKCEYSSQEECVQSLCNWYDNKCSLLQENIQFEDLVFRDKETDITKNNKNITCNPDITGLVCNSEEMCINYLAPYDCKMSSSCTKNICQYKSIDPPKPKCTKQSDCDDKTYCCDGICAPLGETVLCTTDEECKKAFSSSSYCNPQKSSTCPRTCHP